MAFIVGVFEGDFDAWKQRFDSDPRGRRQVAKGHMIFRSVDNPNLFFVRIEFDPPRRQGLSRKRCATPMSWRT